MTPAVRLKGEVGLEGLAIDPPVPETMLHEPEPTAGALPARVVEVAQSIWLGPALATVEGVVKEMTTSSAVSVQGKLAIVQRKVYVVPLVPEKADVALPGAVIEPPVPETIVQVPVPEVAGFPVRLVTEPQTIWSAPAAATVGAPVKVITTSSNDVGQGELVIVQRRV